MTVRSARSFPRWRSIVRVAVVGLLLALAVALIGLSGEGARVEAAQTTTLASVARDRDLVTESASVQAPSGDAATARAHASLPDRVVVRLAAGAVLPDLAALGLEKAEPVGNHGAYAVEVAAGAGRASVDTTLEQLRRTPGVLSAEPAAVRSACLLPDDPFFSNQWSLPHIGMRAAWDIETGSWEVTVAVLDTGIDKDISDFAGRIVSPYSAVDQRTDWPYWGDTNGHGTAVAAVAAAQGNDGLGMAGVAWNVKIMPVKIAAQGDTYDYVLADGIYWAVDHGADVINISFSGEGVTTIEADAVDYALSHDVVVVASAGNVAGHGVYFPAALPGVVAVGATAEYPTDSLSASSATGPELDLVAPGIGIWSYSLNSGGWTLWNGTSFSAPIVAGVAALLRSADPELTASEVVDILDRSADDLGPAGWDEAFGWGLVDADGALIEATEEPTTTTTVPPSTTTTTVPPSTTTTTTSLRFPDVTAETLYSAQIGYLASLGVVAGTDDGLFHPQDALRRQQFAKMIVLTLGLPVSEQDTSPFTDVMHVPGDLYPYHFVAVAYRNGITEGTKPDRFSPYVSLTRAQMITMATRAAQLPEPAADYVPPFSNFSAVHYPFARKAASAGLLDGLVGMGSGYDFLAPASRGEACALLYKLLQ